MPAANENYTKLLNKKLGDTTRQLELLQAHTNAIFSSIGDGIVATDKNGRIEQVNEAALQMLGYKEQDMLGEWFPGIVKAKTLQDKDIDTLDRPVTRAFLTEKPISEKLLYLRKDGTTIPVSLTVSPITSDGMPIGAVEVFRDITADYHMDKMKDDFISIASHQLRTPATGVKQYVGMLLEGYVGEMTDSQIEMLAKAYESNERQLKIIEDLLRVAKVEAGKITLRIEQVDLYEMVEDIMRELGQKFLDLKQTVSVYSSSKPLYALADCDRLRMALENMIENASKYTPSGGRINVSLQKKGHYIVIRIADTGIGISPEDKQRLFQKFIRLGRPSVHAISGSGLGLYWAKQIIDLHSGSIHVHSELGKGTEFCIRIPIKQNC